MKDEIKETLKKKEKIKSIIKRIKNLNKIKKQQFKNNIINKINIYIINKYIKRIIISLIIKYYNKMVSNKLQRIMKYTLFSAIFAGTLYLIIKQGIRRFIVNLPTVYHSIFFIFLGIWLWGINIHVLEKSSIDCTTLLAGAESRSLRNPNSSYISYQNTYKLALGYTAMFFSSVLIYNICDNYYEKSYTEWIAVATLIIALYTLFMPQKFLYRRERKKFVE